MSFSVGLVGVSIQIRRVFGRIAASSAAMSVKVEIGHLQPGRALAHALEQTPRAAIEVVDRDDVRAVVETVERGRDRGQPGGKGKGRAAAFEIGDAALERHARRVLGARVVVALVHARALLDVGRGGIDRHHHRAGGRIGLLPGMHAAGGEVEVGWSSSGGDPEIVDEVEPRRHADELIAVHDDGDVVLAEQRHEIGDRRIGRDGFEPRHHHVLHRQLERLVGAAGIGDQRREHVALVDKTDDVPASRRSPEAARRRSSACARTPPRRLSSRPHHDRGAFTEAADDDVAHGAVALGMGPALLRQERRVEHLREIFRAGIADQRTTRAR